MTFLGVRPAASQFELIGKKKKFTPTVLVVSLHRFGLWSLIALQKRGSSATAQYSQGQAVGHIAASYGLTREQKSASVLTVLMGMVPAALKYLNPLVSSEHTAMSLGGTLGPHLSLTLRMKSGSADSVGHFLIKAGATSPPKQNLKGSLKNYTRNE